MQTHAVNFTTCQAHIDGNDLPGLDVPFYMPPLPQQIFFQTNATIAVHRNAMALDIWLKQACGASAFDPPGAIQNEVVSEGWFFDASKTKDSIRKHFKRDSGHHNIRLHETYCERGYYGIRLPCIASQINTVRYRLYQQHKCDNVGRSVACTFGASAGRIYELPYPAARYTLYLFATVPAEYLDPFLWGPLRCLSDVEHEYHLPLPHTDTMPHIKHLMQSNTLFLLIQ